MSTSLQNGYIKLELNKTCKLGDTVDNTENMNHTEKYEIMMHDLKIISLKVDNLINENKELKALNDELEKENEKLHDIILKMSQ